MKNKCVFLSASVWAFVFFAFSAAAAEKPEIPNPMNKKKEDQPMLRDTGGDTIGWEIIDKFSTVKLSETYVLENWKWKKSREKALEESAALFNKIPRSGAHVLVLPIDDEVTSRSKMIDSWQAEWIEKKLKEARESGNPPDLVVLEISTRGGDLLATVKINDLLFESSLPTVAFIRTRAFSGGSVISAGCMRIYMRDTATVGGAQVVMGMSTPEGDLAEKYKSFVRGEFRARAKKYGHPEAISMGMTDRSLSIRELYMQDSEETIRRFFATPHDLARMSRSRMKLVENMSKPFCDSETLINLDSEEALDCGFSTATVNSIKSLLENQLGLKNYTIDRKVPTRTELTRKWASHPLLATLFLFLMFGALSYEFRTPGIGVGFGLAVIFGAVFLFVQFIAASAGIIEISMFAVGVILIILEVVVIPGFGVAGISGISLMALAVIMSFIPDTVQFAPFETNSSPAAMDMFYSGFRWSILSLTAILVTVLLFLWQWKNLPFTRKMQLETSVVGSSHGETEDKFQALVGRTLTVVKACRPAGQVQVDGLPVEADSDGEFIEPGKKVKVLKVSEGRLIIREIKEQA